MEHARQKFYLACSSPSIPRKRAHSLSSCVPKQHIWGKFYYCCESNPPAKSWQYSHTYCWRMLVGGRKCIGKINYIRTRFAKEAGSRWQTSPQRTSLPASRFERVWAQKCQTWTEIPMFAILGTRYSVGMSLLFKLGAVLWKSFTMLLELMMVFLYLDCIYLLTFDTFPLRWFPRLICSMARWMKHKPTQLKP